jgi:CelD/BcsL family acetyltransferase involved in cellulose biosynthesis
MIGARSQPAGAPLAVEELHDRGAIGALAAEWERLRAEVAAAGGTRGPFLAASWFAVFAASLARGRALKLLVAHRGGRVCGILPLYAERRALSGVPARVLRSLSDDHSSRFDLLADGDEAVAALFAHLARDGSWDALELRDVPDGVRATGVDRLVAVARAAGFPEARWPSLVSPYLPLPATPAALDAQLDAKFRSNLRRRARKLTAEVGPIALERVTTAGPDRGRLDAALDDAFRLEAAGWKGQLGTAIACDAGLTARYRALARSFGDRLALYFLKVGGVRRAFHFALVEGGVYYLLKPGYAPELASYGLGHLLVDAVARELIQARVRELDFLGDEMPWKREWTARARPQSWRYVFRPTAFGRALHAWKFRLAPAVARLRRRFEEVSHASPRPRS